MTMTTEYPLVDSLLGGLDHQELKNLIVPMVARLVELDEVAWQARLEDDGFTAQQVSTLKSCVREWLDQINVDDLSQRLISAQDINDEAEIMWILDSWAADVSSGSRLAAIAQAGFPMPLDAVCYAVGHLRALTHTTIEFETMRRELMAQPAKHFAMTPEQVAEGVALSEVGLAEDAKGWPAY